MICCSCKCDKIDSEMSRGKEKSHYHICKKCANEKMQAWRKKNPEKWKALCRRHSTNPATKQKRRVEGLRKYGLTLETFDILLASQDHKCAICARAVLRKSARDGNDAAQVDHCHETDKVRGILCARCNRAIGLIGENASTLRRAAEYLECHQ